MIIFLASILLLFPYLSVDIGMVDATNGLCTILSEGLIVTFGDSLTAGLIREGKGKVSYHPYSIDLSHSLNDTVNKECFTTKLANITDTVKSCGKNGETTEYMVDRLSNELTLIPINKRQHSVIIILGGTNDLAYKTNPQVILKNLINIHNLSHADGLHSIAITLPPLWWPVTAMESRFINQINYF